MEVIIDGTGAVLGRLATFAAKQALLGNKVSVVNCEKIIVTGKKKPLEEVYLNKRNRGGSAQKGPYYSKSTEQMVKRTIRGMLPWKKTTGQEAFKRVRCYKGIPEEYSTKEKKEMKAKFTRRVPHLTIEQISKMI